MRATELIIGDWVQTPTNPHYIVDESDFWREIVSHGTLFPLFEPIPLTPEILEKNGWKEAEFWHEYQEGENTIQACLPDMRGIINGVEIQHFKCDYVHQYQHLLRLFGLNELADNFQI